MKERVGIEGEYEMSVRRVEEGMERMVERDE